MEFRSTHSVLFTGNKNISLKFYLEITELCYVNVFAKNESNSKIQYNTIQYRLDSLDYLYKFDRKKNFLENFVYQSQLVWLINANDILRFSRHQAKKKNSILDSIELL